MIIDVTDPRNPKPVAYVPAPPNTWNIHLQAHDDLMLVIQVADMPAYHALAHRLFATHANVRNVKAYFATHRSKFETRIAV